ncbi:EAL domain-containing protein [Photobacterium sanctipauli]|uniref:EAL domain-containing protein n=1 Tax=Photobacterium sanctipauli TaxID=1342794 RepID=UPI0020A68688|nr:EAL domain-containing protein [Photobacterium sanctipauli]
MSNVFIMALPVSLIATFCNLIAFLAAEGGYSSVSLTVGYVGQMTGHMFPILLNIYLATYVASTRRLPKAAAISCSLAVFFIVSQKWNLISPVIPLPNNFALSLLSAYITCIVIGYIKQVRYFSLSDFNSVVDNSANMIMICILSLGSVLSFFFIAELFFEAYILPLVQLPSLDPSSFYDGLLYEFIRGVLWSVGVNGHNVLHMFKTELYDITVANMADWHNFGTELNIISTNFYDFYTGMGGSGNTISLVLCMLFFSKNKNYRMLAKAVLILSLFNINEPVLFGVPVIFNPIMIVPFLLVPLSSFLLAYGATYIGLIPPLSVVQSWIVPPVISGYLATEGSLVTPLFQIALIAFGMALYYPFFRFMDKRSTGLDLSSIFNNRFFNDEEIQTRSRLTSFIPSLQSNLEAQKEVESLQSNGSFVLHYQPQVDVNTQDVVGFEVLIRYQTKDGKIKPPYFLKSFSQLGLMPELDFWVIDHAVKAAAPYANSPGFCISINVSPETVLTKGFVKSLKRIVAQSELSFEQVEIEITEELLVKDEAKTAKIINELQALGLSVALDDFGTGYSSLAYLSRFDFDKIKIDRSLVLNLDTERGKSLFGVVVQLSRITNAQILVEGIETDKDLAFIAELGVRYVQGYYYYRPMSLEALEADGIILSSVNRVSSEGELG